MQPWIYKPKNLLKNWAKYDKFILSNLSVFEKKDQNKLTRINNYGNFVKSLAPIASLVIVWHLPLYYVYPDFDSLRFIWQLPLYTFSMVICREIYLISSLKWQYRFKRKLYEKYLPLLDLTKEQIEMLEEDGFKLELEYKSNDKNKPS